jgi:hypothetical protein
MIRILRLIEYTYVDNEDADEDMNNWQIPPIGGKSFGGQKIIRSTILTDLDFGKEVFKLYDGDSVLGRCIHGVDLDKDLCEKGCRL